MITGMPQFVRMMTWPPQIQADGRGPPGNKPGPFFPIPLHHFVFVCPVSASKYFLPILLRSFLIIKSIPSLSDPE